MSRQEAYEILVTKRNEIYENSIKSNRPMDYLSLISQATEVAAEALGEMLGVNQNDETKN